MALYLLPGHISVNYSMFFTPQVATVTRLNVEFIPDTTRFAQPAFFFTSICLKSLELIQKKIYFFTCRHVSAISFQSVRGYMSVPTIKANSFYYV